MRSLDDRKWFYQYIDFQLQLGVKNYFIISFVVHEFHRNRALHMYESLSIPFEGLLNVVLFTAEKPHSD